MKKYSNYILSASLATGLLVGSGCNLSDFGDTNVNPNATTVPITSALFTNVMSGMGGPAAFLRPGLFAQYYSETQYTDASLYSTPQFGWDGIYAGPLFDLQNIINNNVDPVAAIASANYGSNANQIALARILKVYQYMYLTDEFGDLPFSQALTGDSKPVYDSQEDVYKGMFKELAEAVAQFDGGQPIKGDIIYDGTPAPWKKFANTLRLVLALRISKADANLGKAEANAAIAGGVMESNDDNASINYPGGVFQHPWFGVYDGRKDYAISDVFAKILTDLNDPRINAYAQANNGKIEPMPYGLTRDNATKITSFSFVLADEIRKQNSSFVVLSAAHAYLARTEAALLGWTSENAANMYAKGIEMSWKQWGVFDQTRLTTYLASASGNLGTGDAALTKARLQRYIAFYPDGTQGWSEWRRTGVPALVPTPNATNASKQIPRRLVYPASEPGVNGDSYKAAVARISSGDTQDGRVWWDK